MSKLISELDIKIIDEIDIIQSIYLLLIMIKSEKK